MSLFIARELKIKLKYCEFDTKSDGMYRLKCANSYGASNLSM